MSTTATPKPSAKKPAARKPRATTSATRKAAAGLVAAAATPAGALPIDLLDPKHFTNPRGDVDTKSPAFLELVASVKDLGLLEPIVVGPALVDGGKHPIVAGWRRHAAAKAAKLPSVPVHQVTITEAKDALVAALAENIARDDMTPLAEARAIDTLMNEHGYTQVAAGKAVGMAERTVRERLRLLKLPEAVASAISDGTIAMDSAVMLQRLGEKAPVMAAAIVDAVRAGRVKRADLNDPDDFFEVVLADIDPEPEEQPARWVDVDNPPPLLLWPLPDDLLVDLGTKLKGAPPHVAHVKFSEEDLADARAAGVLAEYEFPNVESWRQSTVQVIEDAEWLAGRAPNIIDRQIAAHEKAEKAAKAATAKAKREAEKAGEDPAEAARKARHTEIEARALPAAVAMNERVGQELRKIKQIPVTTAAMQLLIATRYGTWGNDVLAKIDPIYQAASQRVVDEIPNEIARAKSPEEILAIALRPHLAAVLVDARGLKNIRLPEGDAGERQHRELRAFADELGLVTDRHRRLWKAQEKWELERDRCHTEPRLRRVLWELAQEKGRKGLELSTIQTRMSSYRGDIPDGVEPYGYYVVADAYREQLLEEALIKRANETTDNDGRIRTYYAITEPGKARLKEPPVAAPEPIDIDPIEGEPATSPVETLELKGTRREKILQVIAGRPGCTDLDIALMTAIQTPHVRRITEALGGENAIETRNGGWHLVEVGA